MKKLLNSQGLLLFLTLAAALAGALLRRYQLANELLSDGTLLPGSKMHIVLIVLLVLYAAAVIALLRPLRKKRSWQEVFPAGGRIYYLQYACGLLLFIANIVLLITDSITVQQQVISHFTYYLSKLLPFLGFAASGCIVMFSRLRITNRRMMPGTAILYMVVSVYLTLRLILNFQSWNTDPSIHDYCYRLLAAICTMLATYQLAGFCLDVGRRRITTFWALGAVVLNAIAFVDYVYAKNWGELLVSLALCFSMLLSAVQVLFAAGRRSRQLLDITPPSDTAETAD